MIRLNEGRVTAAQFNMERQMDVAIGFLTFGTLGFVMAFAYISARATEKLRREGGARSALSRGNSAKVEAELAARRG